MFVRKKTWQACESQLADCREQLARTHCALLKVWEVTGSDGGVFRRIRECRQIAAHMENLKRDGRAAGNALNRLAAIDGWLMHLALALPESPGPHAAETSVLKDELSAIYPGVPGLPALRSYQSRLRQRAADGEDR